MGYNIAIDGPAGAGKSTIARRAAEELGYLYVDTGAMYRAVALYMIQNKISADDQTAVAEACGDVDISLRYEDGAQQVYLNGENVSGLIRSAEVSRNTSVISGYPEVRVKLLGLQREIAAAHDVVMDGRDIGTSILPDAQLKIYLTASVHTRALRRFEELKEKGTECSLPEIEKEIEERDYRDMHREAAPLKKAEDAVLIDSSDLTIEEVTQKVVDLVRGK